MPGGGGVLKGSLSRGGRRGLQTPTLFKTKTSHFATLFKTGDTTFCFLTLICFVLHTELSNFHTKILEIDI